MFHRKEDYIVKMLTSISPMIAALLHLRRAKRYDEAESVITNATKEAVGLDPLLVQKLSPEAIMHMLNIETTEGAARCLVLTDLLREKGIMYEEQGKVDEGYAQFLKAFTLYHDLFSQTTVDLEDHLSADELNDRNVGMLGIADRLRALGAPSEVLQRAFAFYERQGAYAKAEDTLFDLLEEYDHDEALIQSGIAFYNRLMAKTDEQLVDGDLPRVEVETSLQELAELLDEIS